MIVGFTGSREGMTQAQSAAYALVLAQLDAKRLHHGDCVGADEQAARYAKSSGVRVVGHPPIKTALRAWFQSDETRAPKSYFARNRDIVEECDVLIGCPSQTRHMYGGTWYTIDHARQVGRRVILITPDGVITQ